MTALHTIVPAFTAIFNAMVILALTSQGWRVLINRYFAIAASAIVFWALGVIIFYSAKTIEMAEIGILLFYIAPLFTVLFTSLFAAIFPARHGVAFNTANVILTLVTIVTAGLIIYNPSFLTDSINLHSQGNQLVVSTIGYSLYTVYFSFAFTTIFVQLLLNMRGRKENARKQVQYVFSGIFITCLAAFVTNLMLPILGQSQYIWLGPVWTLFYIVTISISMVKHQLFDVKLAFVRSLVYICVLVVLSLIYIFIAYLISLFLLPTNATDPVSISPINIGVALILAFAFQPVKRFFDRMTNDIFYQDAASIDDFYSKFNHLLASSVDLRSILQRAASEIASTIKADESYFFIYYSGSEDTQHFLSAGTDKYKRFSPADADTIKEMAADYKDKEVIVRSLLDEDSKLNILLNKYKTDLLMPLRHDNKLIGYLSLGPRMVGRYTQRDIDLVAATSNSLIIAIQNALSVHTVKELNLTLQQRIDAATEELRQSNVELQRLDTAKDEFLSIASHQLRTPLTSVKGYISMLLDGDAGRTSESQRYLLSEAFKGSERMVGLINDFLNVSRIQSGKFMLDYKKFDIVELVRLETDSLQSLASSRTLKLNFSANVDVCMIEADENKIRQIIMNYIDNAIYYSKSKTTIEVKLFIRGDSIELKVKDSGIGVPADEQSKLFTKFFRAGNARLQRPDGTGVGIYLAKRIINEHNGKLIFESVEGKGSTFGFVIPRRPKAAGDN